MFEMTGESVALLTGAIVFAVAACFPGAFVGILGAGRVHPSERGLVGVRLLAAICCVRVLARLLTHG